VDDLKPLPTAAPPAAGSSDGPSLLARTGLVLLIVVLGFGWHLAALDQPWDRSQGAINGSWYLAQPVRYWDWFGFEAVRGMPLLAALPTTPASGMAYTHHPPGFPWLGYAAVRFLGDRSERAFRLLPAACSALCGGLIVLLALRRGSFAFAAGCGFVWLVLPMSLLYGAMVNPESATLFFMLATFVLHDRLRAAPWPLYAAPVVSQFLAGQMDWQGHFAVPAIFAWELARRRGDRRIRRVFALGVASVASAFVVVVLIGFFVDTEVRAYDLARAGAGGPAPAFEPGRIFRYAAAGVHDAVATSSGSLEKGVTWAAWAAPLRENVAAFFTWGAVALVAIGAVLAPFLRTPALVLGLVLLLPGLLNIVVFRAHAWHEFWLWYATPGVAMLVPEVLRLVLRRPILVAAGLAVVAGWCAWSARDVIARWRTTDVRDAGRELDQLATRPDDILVLDLRFAQVTYYARSWVLAVSPPSGTLHEIRELKMTGRMKNALVFLVTQKPEEVPVSSLESELARFGAVRPLPAEEVAATFPVTARTIAPGPWWVVRVE
jgi:hypothetical protein